MHKRLSLLCVVLLVFGGHVFAQELPSHGAAVAGGSRLAAPAGHARSPSGEYWQQDIGLELIFTPSPDENRFTEGLGAALSTTWPLQAGLASRLSVGLESLRADEGEDADLIPLGFSFLIGPPGRSPVQMAVELGLRYVIVDYRDEGGSYGDAVDGVAGLSVMVSASEALGIELGAGYRFDLSKSQNDINEELSLAGVQIRLAVRMAF